MADRIPEAVGGSLMITVPVVLLVIVGLLFLRLMRLFLFPEHQIHGVFSVLVTRAAALPFRGCCLRTT